MADWTLRLFLAPLRPPPGGTRGDGSPQTPAIYEACGQAPFERGVRAGAVRKRGAGRRVRHPRGVPAGGRGHYDSAQTLGARERDILVVGGVGGVGGVDEADEAIGLDDEKVVALVDNGAPSREQACYAIAQVFYSI